MVDLRLEYPRPQLVREDWICLNGEWDFEVDHSEQGEDLRYFERDSLNEKIIVPYCPESVLSGIGRTEFMDCVWYRRDIELPECFKGKRAILHFGAVDYHARVYVNGKFAGEHKGGYTPFSFDVTDLLKEEGNYISVCAYDHVRSGVQCAGKQSGKTKSYGCFYTRITGIWQSVWMEPVDPAHLINYKVYPDITNCAVTLQMKLTRAASCRNVKVEAFFEGAKMGEASAVVASEAASVCVKLAEKHLWDLGVGALYDLKITVSDGETVLDSVEGYFGLREIGMNEKGMTINGRTFFGRWVLDQGYYPDGLYTAPSDEALKKDVEYGMQLGFNGARLHQKIFEPRYLYWADKMGYTLWDEQGNWGMDWTKFDCLQHFLPEWLEAIDRDFNHPSIVGWCPFNETWDINGARQSEEALRMVYQVTKAVDPTRPCIDTSGSFHVATDIYDVHDYMQDPVEFAKCYEEIDKGIVRCQLQRIYGDRMKYTGGPVFMSEYGGARWVEGEQGEGWGYGQAVKTPEEFVERYKGLTDVLLDHKLICAMCYTQLYDIEQECNGLMTYDRKFKFDPAPFHAINTRKAAIED